MLHSVHSAECSVLFSHSEEVQILLTVGLTWTIFGLEEKKKRDQGVEKEKGEAGEHCVE